MTTNDLPAQKSTMTATVHVTRAATGAVDTVVLTLAPLDDESEPSPKEIDDGCHAPNSDA
jgi:hypothetical protein